MQGIMGWIEHGSQYAFPKTTRLWLGFPEMTQQPSSSGAFQRDAADGDLQVIANSLLDRGVAAEVAEGKPAWISGLSLLAGVKNA